MIAKHGAEEERSLLPRICMPTFSAFETGAFRTGFLEGQDILVECEAVELIHLEPSRLFEYRKNFLSRLVYHDISRRLVFRNPGLRPVRLTKEYDLFLLVCPWWQDVWYANAIQEWQDHCRVSVCWIMEQWVHAVPDIEYWLPILSRFDHVIVGIDGSGKALGDAIGRPPCPEIHQGVDAIRFSPYPNPPSRTIDVYSMGRRLEGIHRALLPLAAQNKIFYVYDTVQTGASHVPDHRQHRQLYANMAKRSRFFMVAPGKANCPELTRGQSALGPRYYDGSAAGAVLLGQKADCATFRRHFDWPDAVIELQPDGSDAVEVLSKLSADPERIREISRRNAVEALRRHDWIYRWKEILGLAGLRPTSAMAAREKRLGELAEWAREGRAGR